MKQLTEQEQKLLELYRLDKKRKRKRLFLCFILIISVIIGGTGIYNVYFTETEKQNKPIVKEKDTDPPVLELSADSIEITQGDSIDYLSYVSKAEDKNDGNLIEKVKATEIDTNIIGEFTIIYTVSDKAGNDAEAEVKVKITEKKEEPKPETGTSQPDEGSQIQETVPPAQTQQSESQTQPSAPQAPPQTTVPVPPASQPSTQYFLFTDGYTMQNVGSACASALSASGRSGACTPIQDENGIYTGMRLDLY